MPMRTRSAAMDNPEDDLTYSTKNALLQMKESVEKVCTVNARTEEKVQSFTGYFELTEAGLLVLGVCAIHNISIYRVQKRN